jgi:hypothetical protein
VAAQIYIATNRKQEPSSPSSSAFVISFLDDSHYDWGEMESQCSLICISLVAKDGHFFVLFIGHLYFFVCKVFAHLLIGLFAFLPFNFFEFFIYSS